MRIVVSLLIFLCLVSCSDKDKVPSGIIPREKMGKILWDMIQADQYSTIYLAKDSTRINPKMETLKLYQQVFQLHQVSRDEFRKSFQYYLGRPDMTKTLFDSLLAQGNRLRTESYSAPRPDSSKTQPPAVPVKPPADIPHKAMPPAK